MAEKCLHNGFALTSTATTLKSTLQCTASSLRHLTNGECVIEY